MMMALSVAHCQILSVTYPVKASNLVEYLTRDSGGIKNSSNSGISATREPFALAPARQTPVLKLMHIKCSSQSDWSLSSSTTTLTDAPSHSPHFAIRILASLVRRSSVTRYRNKNGWLAAFLSAKKEIQKECQRRLPF